MRRAVTTVMLGATLSCAASGFAQTAAPQAAPSPQAKAPEQVTVPAHNDYAKAEAWLCRPGRTDACAADLAATVIAADGKLTHESWSADAKADVDCFYVYPTVSTEPTGNASMEPRPEEIGVVRIQFARFAAVCRPYAPLYRQATLTALRAAARGTPIPVDRELAYNDVLDAWNYYLEHDNQGRGVILIGHSQGSGVLLRLIRAQLDGKPVQARMVSAMLLGMNVAVPEGKDVGGAFEHVPLCHRAKQTGCVITYVSFRASAPPPENSRFGHVQGEGMRAGCTNPAALGGGSGELHGYFPTRGGFIDVDAAEQKPWVKGGAKIETGFVSLPGLLTAECVADKNGSYLAVTVHGDAAGPRVDDIAGDVVVNGRVLADWGLHLIDVQEAIGNLVEIAREESAAYLAGSGKGK
jgi:hypothetical protein